MTPILLASAGNPAPDNHTAGYFESTGGTRLRYAIFRCALSPARGTVVVLQGRNESVEKYFETIREINAAGFWVATFDWRGQGGSDRLLRNPRRGHVRRFADYERDLSTFLDHIVLPDTRLPFFMLAHSMGALVALSQAPLLANRIDRLILSAPFLALGAQVTGQRTIRLAAGLATLFGFGRFALNRDRASRPFETNVLTSDPSRFERNRTIAATHPQLALGPPSARWLTETFSAIQRVSRHDHLTRITVPTLILGPVADALVPHAAAERVARQFRAATFLPIDGARHELFQEADRFRAQAMAATLAFLPERGR